MALALPWLLLGYVYWLALIAGQLLLLMLSERAPLRARWLRSLGYWAAAAGLLYLMSLQPTLARVVVLPLVVSAALPLYALEALISGPS